MNFRDFESPAISCSLVKNKVKLYGNIDIVFDIKTLLKEHEYFDLYEAQDFIKNEMIQRYGEDWYLRSAEAIQFTVEDYYSDKLREKQPYINDSSYDLYSLY